MTRHGTVLVFKAGVPRDRIVEAIRSIAPVLDPDYHLPPSELARYGSTADAVTRPGDEPLTLAVIESFEDTSGTGPVWYVPEL